MARQPCFPNPPQARRATGRCSVDRAGPPPPFPGGDALTRGVCYQSLKDRSDLTKSSQDRRFGGVIENFLPFSAQLGEEWTHILDPRSVTLTADRKPSRQRPSQVTRSKD